MSTRCLGVLMLETSFLRIPGDIGNPDTFDFPVLYRVVQGASASRVVREQDEGLIELFAAAAKDLVAAGATAITTSCGFLARFQNELASQITVPFAASALSYLETLRGTYSRVGIITADAQALKPETLPRNGIDPEVIVGLEASPAFRAAIVDGAAELDPVAISHEVRMVAQSLAVTHPDLEAVILECTNLPPYIEEISKILRVPIYDATTLARDLMQRA